MGTIDSKFSISDLDSIYNQLNAFTNGKLNKHTSYNGVAWFSQALGIGSDVENFVKGDERQKLSSAKNLISKLVNILKTIGGNETANAQNETKATAEKAEQLQEEAKTVGVRMEGEFEEIQADIESETNIIENAQNILEEIQKNIETQKQEIQNTIEEIKEKQAELTAAVANNDSKEQAKILAEIQVLSGKINGFVGAIENQQGTVKNLNETVEEAVDEVATATDKMTVTMTDGQAKIGQLTGEAANTAKDIPITATKATTNAGTATGLATAGAAASATVIGASVGAECEIKAADQGAAATTRLASIGSNTARIKGGIGEIQNNAEILTSFNNTIGSALTNFTSAVGSYQVKLPNIVTSIGSIATVKEDNTNLSTLAEEDLQTITESAEEFKNETNANPNETNLKTLTVNFRSFGI